MLSDVEGVGGQLCCLARRCSCPARQHHVPGGCNATYRPAASCCRRPVLLPAANRPRRPPGRVLRGGPAQPGPGGSRHQRLRAYCPAGESWGARMLVAAAAHHAWCTAQQPAWRTPGYRAQGAAHPPRRCPRPCHPHCRPAARPSPPCL
jgi:hypothetical protein